MHCEFGGFGVASFVALCIDNLDVGGLSSQVLWPGVLWLSGIGGIWNCEFRGVWHHQFCGLVQREFRGFGIASFVA